MIAPPANAAARLPSKAVVIIVARASAPGAPTRKPSPSSVRFTTRNAQPPLMAHSQASRPANAASPTNTPIKDESTVSASMMGSVAYPGSVPFTNPPAAIPRMAPGIRMTAVSSAQIATRMDNLPVAPGGRGRRPEHLVPEHVGAGERRAVECVEKGRHADPFDPARADQSHRIEAIRRVAVVQVESFEA